MYFVDNGSAVPVMPQVKPVSSATPQFFTEGGNGTPPTYPGPDWFNIFQLELLNVLKEAQINPDKANHTQLVTAMKKLFLDASSNGSDIPDKAAFLSNLGIKSAALRDVTMTDSPDHTELLDVEHADGRYLWKDSNGSDIPDKATFRQNLQLGTAARANTGVGANDVPTTSDADARYLRKASNGSDIADKAAFRTNLELKSAAQRPIGSTQYDVPDIQTADTRYLTQSTTDASGYSILRTPMADGKTLIKQSGFINLTPGLQNILNLPVSLSQVITSAHISIVDADPGPDKPIGISPQSLNLIYVRNWGSNSLKARWTVEGI